MDGSGQQRKGERVTLTASQLERLDRAVIRRPARTFVDRDGITRVTQVYLDNFVADLVRFHRRYGYLTGRQYARIAWLVKE